MIALGFSEQFFILVVCTTFHELAHILVARIFGLSCDRITFTPLGEIAGINGLEQIHLYKRLLVLIAGAGLNLLIALLSRNKFVILVNYGLAILNLLPIYPLDGGRIFYYILCRVLGILRAGRVMLYVGTVLSCFIMLLGFLQLLMFNCNISLLCMGLYLFKTNKREYINKSFGIYKLILNIKPINALKLNFIYVNTNTAVKEILFRLSWDYYLIAYGENTFINQEEIINYILIYGINGTVKDVLLAKPG